MPFYELRTEEALMARVKSVESYVRADECREIALDRLALAVAHARRAIQWTAHVRNRLIFVSSTISRWKPGECGAQCSAAAMAREHLRRLREHLDEMERLLEEGVATVAEFDESGVELDDGDVPDRPGVPEVLEEVVEVRPGELGDLRVGGVSVDGDGDDRLGVDAGPASAVVVQAGSVLAEPSWDDGQEPEGLDAGLHADAVDVDLDAVEDLVEVHESSSSVGGSVGRASDPTEEDPSPEGERVSAQDVVARASSSSSEGVA